MRSPLHSVSALVCSVALLSCGTARPDRLEVTHEESVDIPGGPNILPANALAVAGAGAALEQAITQSLDNQGVRREEVKSITLKLFRLQVTAPLRNGEPAQDLRFLDRVEMTIQGKDLPAVKTAESLPAPSGNTQSASFGPGVYAADIPPVPGAELRDHATAESMDVTVTVAANGRPAFSCTVKVTITLDIQLDVAGAAATRLPLPGG